MERSRSMAGNDSTRLCAEQAGRPGLGARTVSRRMRGRPGCVAECTPRYAATLLHGAVAPGAGDALFVFSNSGRNAVPVEMALEAKKRGATTLCITSLAHASAVSPRNPAGLRLHEACDIVLDNGGVPGDAAIEVGPYRCGPTSTVAGAALLQAVVCGVVEALVAEGREPEVFRSANEDGGDEANEAFLRKYRASIPML